VRINLWRANQFVASDSLSPPCQRKSSSNVDRIAVAVIIARCHRCCCCCRRRRSLLTAVITVAVSFVVSDGVADLNFTGMVAAGARVMFASTIKEKNSNDTTTTMMMTTATRQRCQRSTTTTTTKDDTGSYSRQDKQQRPCRVADVDFHLSSGANLAIHHHPHRKERQQRRHR
jgi:hypothetical protein